VPGDLDRIRGGASAHEGRSSAIGLYVSSFYIGGSVGGLAAGALWSEAGWPAVVALSTIVLAVIELIVTLVWRDSRPATPQVSAYAAYPGDPCLFH
jgi:predicted MFS family arabinose efflux permease